jgi:hypothetical protein
VEAYQKIRNLGINNYDEFVKKYGPLTSDGPEQTAFLIIGMFCEGIGVLLHRKLVDIDIIRELFPVEAFWLKFEPIITGYRKQTAQPKTYEWFEYLYNEVKKRE